MGLNLVNIIFEYLILAWRWFISLEQALKADKSLPPNGARILVSEKGSKQTRSCTYWTLIPDWASF